MISRICTKCGVEKELEGGFYKRKSQRGGFATECKDCRINAAKAAYRKNPQATKDRVRKWQADNPEAKKRYYKSKSDAYKKRAREWVALNPEKRKAIAKQSASRRREDYLPRRKALSRVRRIADLEKAREAGRMHAARRRSRLRESGIDIEFEQWRAIADFSDTCLYCGKLADKIVIDHFFPVSRGGPTEPGNLVPACQPCNSRKSDKHPDDWLRSIGHCAIRSDGSLTIREFLSATRKAFCPEKPPLVEAMFPAVKIVEV
ncbi:HNH endonuclease [Mesorhizobium sp. BR1-1-9]|uniref:HNH endonuclease n=1 Tax=Mesorhizobium sp. BR1-1-9 TaxID=2876646 RepID=UPI001CD15E82|nr:HNH endonuclease [Mesorhizobium sp. BR1-1-9]MBZ9873102.1 HNH endonuclease [Mesorhizobium sp. BR1-1-9]